MIQIAASCALLPIEKCPQYISIIEDSLDQLSVLMDIESDCTKTVGNRPPLSQEITRILKDQKSLETRYQDLAMDQESLKSLPNKTRFKESKVAMNDISHELSASIHTLSRGLKSHPSVAQNLIKIQNERSALQTLLSKSLRELKEERKFESLSNTVHEEYRKKDTLKNTINSEIEASDRLKGLVLELAAEKRLLDEEAAERNAVIQQLKDTIQEISSLTNSEQKYIKKETKAHEASVRLKCLAKEAMLEKDREHMHNRLRMETRAHEKVVDFLFGQRADLESQIQDWIGKYEHDTEHKSNELEQVKLKRTADLEKFELLVTRYEELERVVEDDRANKQKEAEESRTRKIRNLAATRIQRWLKRAHIRIAKAQAALQSKAPGKGQRKKK